MAMRNSYSQWFPPTPALTEKNLPSQAGKIVKVTGGNQGVTFELIQILYIKGATVYMASHLQQKAQEAIKSIKANNTGGDVGRTCNSISRTLPPSKLQPPALQHKNQGSTYFGTMPAWLLIPQLRNAAQSAPKDSVCIIWTASWMDDAKGGLLDFSKLATGTKTSEQNYANSKIGNWIPAVEGAKRYGGDGILSLAQNPGNLASNIWSAVSKMTMMLVDLLLHKVVFGAYKELCAGLSGEITVADNGGHVIPWGRVQRSSHQKDLLLATKEKDEGGSGLVSELWI